MPRTTIVAITRTDELAAAADVWQAARRAGGHRSTPVRRERLEARLRDSGVALLASYGDRPAGMAVAATFVDDGVEDPTCGHVAMVLVDPAYWGCGIGGALVRALQAPPEGTQWARLSVWTRTDNRRALRLYDSGGFTDTGERSTLHDGEQISRLEWRRPG